MTDDLDTARELGMMVGRCSGTHSALLWHRGSGDSPLDFEKPIVLALLEGMANVGVRDKHKRFRSALKKYGVFFLPSPDSSEKVPCPRCYGRARIRKWQFTGWVDIDCPRCGGSKTVEKPAYKIHYEGE